MKTELFKASLRLRVAEAMRWVHLEAYGDHVAAKKKWHHVEGIEAIHLLLAEKYGWTPNECRALSLEETWNAVGPESAGWTLPKDLRGLGEEFYKSLEKL